jgi:hypothetical protein
MSENNEKQEFKTGRDLSVLADRRQSKITQKNDNENEKDKAGLRKISRKKTVSLSSVFNYKKKKKKKKNKCDLIRKFIYHLVDNIYLHIFVLFLSVYSLFMEDISNICLSKSVDPIFEHINEGVFFFFFTEFLLLIISKKNFIGSFYFYLDMISIISLLPNCNLIWKPLIEEISGTG